VKPRTRIPLLRIIARLNIGGPALHTVILTQGLKQEGFDTVLACGPVDPQEGDMSYFARERGVEVRLIPSLTRKISPLKDLTAAVSLFKLCLEHTPWVIHTHTAKAGALGRLAGYLYKTCFRNRNTPCVLVHTFHGHVLEGYFHPAINAFFTALERLLCLTTDRILTVSDSVKEELVSRRICPADKIEVIPLGFDLSAFTAVTEPKETETFTIAMVGRMVPIKNHRMLLEALALLKKKDPRRSFSCVLAGDGELRPQLEAYARELGIENQVHFSGWQKDTAQIYSRSDCVVLTSLNEGTSVSLIEAMASGRAVAATRVGGVPDLMGRPCQPPSLAPGSISVHERGILVASGDAAALAEALDTLRQQPALRAMLAARGRAFASTAFTRERLCGDIKNLYAKLLKQ
jgi:glycosyltransferase involved in cell wall biosynthesis